MLWEVEIRPTSRDAERERVCDEFDLLTGSVRGMDLVTSSARGYVIGGKLDEAAVLRLTATLLVDPLVESATVVPLGKLPYEHAYTVLFKPGVMDPTAESVLRLTNDWQLDVTTVRTFRRYYGKPDTAQADQELLCRKVIANEAIEAVVNGPLPDGFFQLGTEQPFQKVVVPIRELNDDDLLSLSRAGQLALTLEEMRTVQAHFRELGRDPTDCELETVAQTWSEHCSHKTLRGRIEYTETVNGVSQTFHYQNLLKETIFQATQTVRERLGENDWCVSVFVDNAGIVRFTDQFHVCIKVETHNRPSALEPYGGANTGLGGVIRDVLGTGLGGTPICNTDVFCFARPNYPNEDLPAGVLHPRRVIQGVVAGVRDYGNRMGIPTVNGAVLFDDRYLANPLVFCGTVGLIPVGMETKLVSPGELIVAVGGLTGRDGIHGATFSSEQLTEQSEQLSGGAVQIGNPIEEKKLLDVILKARDRRLYTAVTDCGAGGFSSAVGEMGAETGAEVRLEAAPLKYQGLTYTEIWISESQERMVLSVPKDRWPELKLLCESEDVSASVLGEFTDTGKLKLTYHGETVADLSMHFLHEGRPKVSRQANWAFDEQPEPELGPVAAQEALFRILGSLNVSSKEWVIRQYDHEVQGGSVVKPLVGVHEDGPSDAAVVAPVLGETAGIVVGCGICPQYADIDPAAAAACAIDEALRNVVAVGADPARVAILDNFCWGNVNEADMLGALVRTAKACQDVAEAYSTPFVSGKDSLNNEYRSPERRISIPHTLLITALGQMADVRRAVTMDLKSPGNAIYILGETANHLGGSHLYLVSGINGGQAPRPNLELAPKLFAKLHEAIRQGLVRSCHDLSEGGLAVAVAEMAFAGEVGVDLDGCNSLPTAEPLNDLQKLFSESPTRFLLEVTPDNEGRLAELMQGLPFAKIGTTQSEPRLRIADQNGEWFVWAKLADLKEAWQKPFRLAD